MEVTYPQMQKNILNFVDIQNSWMYVMRNYLLFRGFNVSQSGMRIPSLKKKINKFTRILMYLSLSFSLFDYVIYFKGQLSKKNYNIEFLFNLLKSLNVFKLVSSRVKNN